MDKRTYVLRMMMLFVMMMGVSGVWGQTDYSGVYYIANKNSYTSNTPDNNWYLVPAANPQASHYADAYFHNQYCTTDISNKNYDYTGDNYGDSGKPFITTYKTGRVNNSIWKIIPDANEAGYYNIIHASTGKYMVYEPPYQQLKYRKSVHLETLTTPGNNAKFTITGTFPGPMEIKPKTVDSDISAYVYLAVSGGNQDQYYGTPSTDYYRKGLIGLWNSSTDDCKWYFEDKIPRPTITYIYNSSTSLYEINITYPEAATIYYTTDGTTPEVGNSEQYNGGFDPPANTAVIKAIAVRTSDGEISNVASYTPTFLIGQSHLYLFQIQGNSWGSGDHAGPHHYMIPGDDENNITKANTTSLLRPSMQWYFMDAGTENDVQYYNFVNAVNNKTLCYDTTNGVYMDVNNDNANKFKFQIVESPTAGSYNIIPYGVTVDEKYLNKSGGNMKPDGLKLWKNNTDANNQWKFILKDALDDVAPFVAADNATTPYYKIQCYNATSYYIIPPTSAGGKVTTSNSTDASVVNSMIWYFEKAVDPTNDDWLTWYFIRNAVTGEYLYYNGATTSSGTNTNEETIEMRSNYDPSSSADVKNRYLFTWARTTYQDQYFIVPRTIRDESMNTIGSLRRSNKLNTDATRENKNASWKFIEEASFHCTKPVITYNSTTNKYEITGTGPTIYYTTDGTDPSSSNTRQTYSSPIDMPTSPMTIRAIAARNSDMSDKSEEATQEIVKVATPTFGYNGDNVTISCVTSGATIYYTTDGTTPTTASNAYSAALRNDISGKTIKAIAVKTGHLSSEVAVSEVITLGCATPNIRRGTGNTFTLSCSFPTEGVTIYYTYAYGSSPADPTTSSSAYNGPVSVTGFPVTVKAFAVADGYSNSFIKEVTIGTSLSQDANGYYEIASAGDYEKFVTMANSTAGAGNKYKVVDNFTVSGNTTVSTTFTGTFVGDFDEESGEYFTISGLRQPLFNSTNNAVIKNVMLKDVQISGSGAKGAIAGTANGYTRIYNCGILPSSNKFESETSDISSTDGYCGGLVGALNGDSRVVNCFSYAKITGGTTVAGIVGYNQTASTAAESGGKYANLKTVVVNCMFYGYITGGTSVYPVYGGEKVLNTGENGINNYDFYRAEASITPSDYNCSWPASEENLTRFEYYRSLLNANRELCGWWVKSDVAPSTMSTADVQAIKKDASLMAKWVLDPAIAPYPILKPAGKYYSVINIDPVRRTDPDSKAWVTRDASDNNIQTNAAPDIHGETLGSISVSINAGIHYTGSAGSASRTITITAMDNDNNDFCYGKIQLPYYNEIFGDPNGTTWSEKYGDNYTDMVVTGWDITTTNVTTGTFSDDPITGYNFADRNCTAKDTHRTFAQGGYYYVPYGVTSITITAHWANAYYLSNTGGNYERVYFSDGSNNKISAGKPFTPAGTRSFGSDEFGGQTINSGTISNALSYISTTSSVYDCAIVLVGNYQYRSNTEDIAENTRKPFTLMTVDLDFDNEPDYCFEWQFGGGGQGVTRAWINPVRFDFLPIVELGIAMKENASKYLFSIGKVTPYGHFEVTETALIHMGQFEYDDQKRTEAGPVILNNGTFDQICRGSESSDNQHVNYFILGGHVKMPSFTPGAHVRKKVKSRHCAVNVLGGEFEHFYLSGNYNANPVNEGDPHCYIDGGKLDFVASGAKEKIVGNVFWEIDHSCIGEFYGGGINADKPVQGNISTTINRSKVTKFCGGPQFGNMVSGKTVTTEATGTTFGVFYGAGNGGTCYSQFYSSDFTTASPNWETISDNISGGMEKYIALTYVSKSQGYHAKYELEMINSSAGTMNNAVCRTYMYAAQFATTTTGTVNSTLTDCTVNGNFFGGGLLGGVTGNVTSTLKGHTVVNGSVYGGGYGIADLTVDVLPKGYTPPTRDSNTSVITLASYPDATTYYWTHDTSFGNTTLSTSSPAILNPNGDGKNYLYTEISLDALGAISGNATLNLEDDTEVHGDVFGGGDKGLVTGTATVNIDYEEPTP